MREANSNDELMVSIKIDLTLCPPIRFSQGIWYRTTVHKKLIKAQCDEDGKPTGTFLLTPSHDEGYVWDIPSYMEATNELAARERRRIKTLTFPSEASTDGAED